MDAEGNKASCFGWHCSDPPLGVTAEVMQGERGQRGRRHGGGGLAQETRAERGGEERMGVRYSS